MMYYGYSHMSAWGWFLMTATMLAFWGILIAAVVLVVRYVRPGASDSSAIQKNPVSESPEELLARRYANGDIDTEEYQTRMSALRQSRHSPAQP